MKKTRLNFRRYEKKYLLSGEQDRQLRAEIADRLRPDEYYKSTVCSLYYDTDDYELIRHSIEKPLFKEKLRLRSYGVPEREGEVFVELKKKFKGVVYKRRTRMPAAEAQAWLAGTGSAPEDTQTCREIDWFLQRYKPVPKLYIACDREAFAAKDDPELRITFDRNIRWREDELDLCAGTRGQLLTQPEQVLMEIKLQGAAPLWLAETLSRLMIFPVGFSKYGSCYKNELIEKYFNGVMEFA